MFDQNNIQIYSDRDKIRTQLIEFMKEYLELDNIDLTKTSYLSYLINILSALTANLLYYSTSMYREMFLTRAIQKESVLNLASMLGYTPPFAISSKAQLLISLPTTFASNVDFSIPAKFQYISGSLKFEQNNEVQITIINPGTDSISCVVREILSEGGSRLTPITLSDNKETLYFNVDVTQEETTELEYTVPTLQPYEFYNLQVTFEGNLSDISVETMATEDDNPTTWAQYDSLFLVPNNVRGYAFRATATGGKLFFGNGIIGRQPPSGHLCKVIVSYTHGSKGNVIAGSINKQQDRLFVEVVENGKIINRTVKLDVINPAPAYNGEDSPNLDEIRQSAMANVASAQRLVSQWDYENIEYIVPDLPVRHSIPIMKRSDIKRNEISVFTDLLFEDYIVPTRNAVWTIDSTNVVNDATSTTYVTSENTTTIDGDLYYSLFDINIDVQYNDCQYLYVIRDVNSEAVTLRTYTDDTEILPSFVNFSTTRASDPDNDYVTVVMNYQQIGDGTHTNMTCEIIQDWDNVTTTMTHDYTNKKFTSTILLQDIPSGEQYFNFNFKDQSASMMVYAQTSTIVTRDLSEYMYSQIRNVGGDIMIYDVPVIKKSYFDSIDKNEFVLQVIHKIVAFNVTNYRMLTDFINLKFSNTTGKMTNMKFNKLTATVLSKDPAEIPASPVNGDMYLLTETDNAWNKVPPVVVKWHTNSAQWSTQSLSINEMVYDLSVDKYIFTGEQMVIPELDIPFAIQLVVWKKPASSISSQAIVERVKNELIDRFYDDFGYDKPIYRSDIVRTVQNVDGVEHCQLIYPKHDIIFDYDIYEDFTQTQLLEYSPQLVYFSTDTITIEVR